MFSKIKPSVLAVIATALAVFGTSAMAQAVSGADYGAAAAITAAQGVALTIIGGFITMGVAVWGASYILRRFFPKGK
jgi:Na+-driven multidrug efflux pump